MIAIGLLVLCGLSVPAVQADSYQTLPANLPSHYGLVGVRVENRGVDSLYITQVHPEGPAAAAGLRVGDRIVAIPPYKLGTADELSRCVQSFAPGENTHIDILRDNQPKRVQIAITDVGHLYDLMGSEGRRPNPTARRHHRWDQQRSGAEELLWTLAQRYDAVTAFERLQQALQMETRRYGGDERLDDVHFLLNNPLKVDPFTRDLASSLDAAVDMRAYVDLALVHLDGDPRRARRSRLPHVPLTEEVLFATLSEAAARVDSAFAAIAPSERRHLLSTPPSLLARFAENGRLDEVEGAEYEAHKRALILAKKVDIDLLFSAALQVADLATALSVPQALTLPAGVPPALSSVGGSLLYARQTPLGWIIVGGTGANYYARDDILCIIDMGGDDVYVRSAADPSTASSGVYLCIDYGGSDRYIGRAGSAIGGVDLLVDHAGNDAYQGQEMAQGTSFCGVGLLWDRQGDDTYRSGRASQGCAFWGAGILVDSDGDDRYAIAQMGQGFGGARGFGLLADWRGSDTYTADHQAPSAYGITDQFSGWAQGVGCGFRGQSSGGMGVLYDREGNDRYQAGEFAQGLGYFFALGMLYDREGNDAYRGRRYAQGAAAHQAIGALVDAAGHDRYWAQTAAGQGAGWDASIGYLRDGSGDDSYRAEHLSQGAAAMNSWGLLIDEGGRDRYRAHSGQGQGGSTTYWGGRGAENAGGLIDLGDQPDAYGLPERRDDHAFKTPGIGIFLDR